MGAKKVRHDEPAQKSPGLSKTTLLLKDVATMAEKDFDEFMRIGIEKPEVIRQILRQAESGES